MTEFQSIYIYCVACDADVAHVKLDKDGQARRRLWSHACKCGAIPRLSGGSIMGIVHAHPVEVWRRRGLWWSPRPRRDRSPADHAAAPV